MTDRIGDVIARLWPRLRLRTILFGVLLFAATMPAIGAISLRVYENTLVRQTEAELVAQGAALAAVAAINWPGAPPPQPRPVDPPDDYFQPEFTTIDLSRDPMLAERPPPRATDRRPESQALAIATRIAPIVERTVRTTAAAVLMLDNAGLVVSDPATRGDLSSLPEVRDALAGRPRTVLRRSGDFRRRYSFEWLSKASGIRLHHARPIVVGDRVVGVLLLSRSPRALFRGLYEDRGKFVLAAVVILGLLIVMAGLVSRGVTRPIERLSRASREVAASGGEIPRTPRTAAVEVRDLYEDFRAMAERIERRSGYLRDFAAAVSHEFKTPLAGINGAVELLQDHFDTMTDVDRRRFLANIAGDGERLSQLVTRLLDLARADMATPAPGVACRIAEPVVSASDGEIGAGFDVHLDLPGTLPRVAAPAEMVEKVIAILLQNARQAGASEAWVRAEATDGDVVLRVLDNGPGVPTADRERLFDPFFTSRRAEGGTGLGLSIARSLLAASGARIELVEGGPGAVFRVTLLRSRAA